jgi:hypothetical protein
MDEKSVPIKVMPVKVAALAIGAAVLVGALLFFLVKVTSGSGLGECCGNSPAGFRNDALFPLDAGNPANLNKCKKSKAQLPDGGVRPLCADTDLVGSATNPCVVTGLRASTCACFEGQAQACNPDGGGPCTSGTNCGIKACIVTSDTASTWSACTCM